MTKQKLKEKLYRFWIYFRRAYGVYFALPVAFLNFVTIQYKLLVQNSFLHELFPSFYSFIMTCCVLFGIACVLLGYYDYKKGSFQQEVRIGSMNNPYFWDLYQTVKKLECEVSSIKALILQDDKKK